MAINNNESEKLQYQTGVSPLKSASVFVLQRLWAHTRSLWVARKTEFIFSIGFLLSKEIRSACFLRSLIYRNSI